MMLMNKIFFAIIVFSCMYLYIGQVYSDSTTIDQETIDKIINESKNIKETSLYSIVPVLVIIIVVLLKFLSTNMGWFSSKKSESYKEYRNDKDNKLTYNEWNDERMSDLKVEIKEQRRLLELLQNEVNKVLNNIKSNTEISVAIKEDIKDMSYEIKCQRDILSDLEVKMTIIEKLFDRHNLRENSGGGK